MLSGEIFEGTNSWCLEGIPLCLPFGREILGFLLHICVMCQDHGSVCAATSNIKVVCHLVEIKVGPFFQRSSIGVCGWLKDGYFVGFLTVAKLVLVLDRFIKIYAAGNGSCALASETGCRT